MKLTQVARLTFACVLCILRHAAPRDQAFHHSSGYWDRDFITQCVGPFNRLMHCGLASHQPENYINTRRIMVHVHPIAPQSVNRDSPTTPYAQTVEHELPCPVLRLGPCDAPFLDFGLASAFTFYTFHQRHNSMMTADDNC